MENKKIKVLGVNIKYRNISDLSKKLDIGDTFQEKRANAQIVIKNIKKKKTIFDNITGDFSELDLKDNPLLIRDFYKMPRLTKAIKDAIISTEPDEVVENNSVLIFDKKTAFSPDSILNLTYNAVFEIQLSEEVVKRKLSLVRVGTVKPIHDIITEYIEAEFPVENIVLQRGGRLYKLISSKITSTRSNGEFDLKKMRLKAAIPCNISVNLYNEIVEVIETDLNNCVVDYLTQIYKKISVKDYFNKDISEGIDTNEILNFCKRYNIKCIAYDINGSVIARYMPIKKSNYKALIYIAYNSHIYPIKNKYLNEKGSTDYEYIHQPEETIYKNIKDLLTNKIIPSKVNMNGINENGDIIIKSFINEKKFYYSIPHYNDLKKILTAWAIEDKLTPNLSKYNAIDLIVNIYNNKNISSFFPMLKNFTIGGYNYQSDRDYEEGEIMSLDKNKCYSHALFNLEYLIYTDIRTAKHIINPTELKSDYIYIAKPDKHSILMPKTFIYSGDFLIYCKNEGLKFELLEAIECEKTDNFYKLFITDYYTKTKNMKLDPSPHTNLIKEMINIHIGRFDKGADSLDTFTEITKICNKEEADETNAANMPFKDNNGETLYFCMKDSNIFKIYTKKLIGYQIKHEARKIIYEKMKELKQNNGVKNEDFINIQTDSITFIKPKNKTFLNINNEFTGWKVINKIGNSEIREITDDNPSTFITLTEEHNNNILYEGLAGCGKTYDIINNIIPNLDATKKYIVCSPNHSTLEEYRQKNINCSVLQKYSFSNTIPEEDIIIIDEIGLCDKLTSDIIYKCHLNNKQIIAYGDYGQLLPVGGNAHLNSDLYLNYIYAKRVLNENNKRNNFTAKYYYDLQNNNINLLNEIKKHSAKDYKNVEAIICYKNETCDKYNELILKHKKLEMGEKGLLVICKTNDLRDLNIYNNFIFTITDTDDEFITLDDTYKIPVKKFFKKDNFKPAYARTVYNIQGKSLKSYYAAPEDYKLFNNGRTAYTIISRLKTI
jgi:hypothetical protein